MHVNFYFLYCNVFIGIFLVLAHPDLYVVSGGLWQLLVEPGKARATVSAAGTTTPIPQRLTLETILSTHIHFVSRVTEIVVAHERRGVSDGCGGSLAWTVAVHIIIEISATFVQSCYKCPDMLSRVSMSDTDSIHVICVNTIAIEVVGAKCIASAHLVTYDLSTYFRIV